MSAELRYTIEHDGDVFEKEARNRFVRDDFPAYEAVWQALVCPLTNRPHDVHFKSPKNLQAQGYTDKDICLAQLHYTILRHLLRAHQLKDNLTLPMDAFIEGITRLSSATDVAFEFLERQRNPSLYDPWIDNDQQRSGRRARQAWLNSFNGALKDVRDYRNHLVHGRITPTYRDPSDTSSLFVPKLGRESTYLDWRTVHALPHDCMTADFDTPSRVLKSAWDKVLCYLENRWAEVLNNLTRSRHVHTEQIPFQVNTSPSTINMSASGTFDNCVL